jgi:hypothetical protein
LLIDASAMILAISDRDGLISLFAQLGSMVLAGVVGRFLMKSRTAILLVLFLGAFGAMVANIMVDGQGAFLYLVFTPVIYFAAVAGRHDLRTF